MPPIYVPGYGSSSAKIMCILPMPTYADERAELPAQGKEGRELARLLSDAGTNINEVYITHVSKYRAPEGNFEKFESGQIEQQIDSLKREIERVKPTVILGFGEGSLFYLTGHSGITDYRGSIIRGILGIKTICTYHPVSLLFEKKKGKKARFDEPKVAWSMRVAMVHDIKRAVEESSFPDIKLPERHLEICRNSSMLMKFLDKYDRNRKVAVDIETIKSIPVCIGLAFCANHAMSIPLINIPGAGNYQLPHSDMVYLWKLIGRLLASESIGKIGQNFKFDHEKLTNVDGFKINNIISDVMFKSHVLHAELPKKLAFTTSIYTREPYYKAEREEFDFRKHSIDKFYKYNAKDAAVTFEVDEAMEESLNSLGLGDFYYNYIMKLHSIFMQIEANGLKINFKKRQELIMKYGNWRIRLMSELSSLIGRQLPPTFINSPVQQKKLLYEERGIPSRSSVDDETLCALLANTVTNPKDRRIIELIYELVRVKRAEGMIKVRPDYDGRMRTSINIVGAETGRDTNGKLDQPVRLHSIGMSFQSGITKHGDYGPEMRTMYEADNGYELSNMDLSQAEARIVALLSEDFNLLSMFGKRDIHKMTAGWVFKKNENEITEDERFCGKTVRHAGNYDMGKRTHMVDIMKKARRFHINISISEKQAGENLKLFHKNSPKIKEVFHEGIKKALIDNKRVLFNPYGRRRIFLDQMGPALHREAFAQIPQSTVADHMKNAMIRIVKRAPWIKILIESHDALLFQTLIGDQTKETRMIVKEELERPINFERCSLKRGELVIPVDCEAGFNYGEMKKIKLVA